LSNKFDFSKAIEQAKARMDNVRLNAIILAPSGGGKSSLCGTAGVPTLYIYCMSETHGPVAASTFATGDVTPICIDDNRDPDAALEFLNALLEDAETLAPFDMIAFDSASGLEKIIRESTELKAACLTSNGKINSFMISEVMALMFSNIIKKMHATGKHTAMTLALDVKAMDSDTGEIIDASPKLQAYGVAENVIMGHSDVFIIGPLSNGEKVSYRIQFNGKVSKASKDAAGMVKRFQNFSPRVTGVKELPSSLPAKLSDVIKLKVTKK
jgi:hypothetical protein